MKVCAETGCDRAHRAKGMCRLHYNRQWQEANEKVCIETDCDRALLAKGMCRLHYDRTWREANRESIRAYQKRRDANGAGADRHRDSHLKKTYGIGSETYEHMAMVQCGACAICGRTGDGTRRLDVDHDHATGAIRGLLCRSCNAGMGNLRDDPALLRRAIDHLGGA